MQELAANGASLLVVTSIMCCKKYLVTHDGSNRRNLLVHDAECLYELDNMLVEKCHIKLFVHLCLFNFVDCSTF
jgi:hypothetical protein